MTITHDHENNKPRWIVGEIIDHRTGAKIEIVDSVVLENIILMAKRSNIGVSKYNTTLDENNHDSMQQHLLEELLDAANYLQKIIKE